MGFDPESAVAAARSDTGTIEVPPLITMDYALNLNVLPSAPSTDSAKSRVKEPNALGALDEVIGHQAQATPIMETMPSNTKFIPNRCELPLPAF